jgi:hypothetical protein
MNKTMHPKLAKSEVGQGTSPHTGISGEETLNSLSEMVLPFTFRTQAPGYAYLENRNRCTVCKDIDFELEILLI